MALRFLLLFIGGVFLVFAWVFGFFVIFECLLDDSLISLPNWTSIKISFLDIYMFKFLCIEVL